MHSVHDYEIISYEVDLRNRKITFITFLHSSDNHTKLIFSEVLAHQFETQLQGSIIYEVYENELSRFIEEHQELLQRQKNYGWPMNYETSEELEAVLQKEKFKYYVIFSSYGLNGWILAKQYSIM